MNTFQDLLPLSDKELSTLLEETEQKLYVVKMKIMANTEKQVHKMKLLKKQIARIKTRMSQNSLTV